MTKISQREARRLKARVKELENKLDSLRRIWVRDYPGGVNIDYIPASRMTAGEQAAVKTACKLGHVVICKMDDGGNLLLYAVKP